MLIIIVNFKQETFLTVPHLKRVLRLKAALGVRGRRCSVSLRCGLRLGSEGHHPHRSSFCRCLIHVIIFPRMFVIQQVRVPIEGSPAFTLVPFLICNQSVLNEAWLKLRSAVYSCMFINLPCSCLKQSRNGTNRLCYASTTISVSIQRGSFLARTSRPCVLHPSHRS